MKNVGWLLCLLLLTGCGKSLPYRTPIQEESPSTLPNKPVQEVQCGGEIPKVIHDKHEDLRLAENSDFVLSIRQGSNEIKQPINCSIFTEDFNGDGHKDYAVILVNTRTSDFWFHLLINRGNGEFGAVAVRRFLPPLNSDSGFIYTAMLLKPAGELGSATRANFPLKLGTQEADDFIAKPAIELWRALDTDVDGLPKNFDISTLAFCSDVFYFKSNVELKQVTVCN